MLVVLATVIVGAPIVSASVSVPGVYVAFVTTLLEVADASVKAADVGAEIVMSPVGASTLPPVTKVAVPVVSVGLVNNTLVTALPVPVTAFAVAVFNFEVAPPASLIVGALTVPVVLTPSAAAVRVTSPAGVNSPVKVVAVPT